MSFVVLYLDDEPDLLLMFKDLYESMEVKVEILSEPLSLVKSVQTLKPDLVILDHRLPGVFGDELAQQLDSNLPKVLITGELAVHPKSNFIRIFHKPYSVDEMQNFLDERVKEKRDRAI